MPNDTNKSEQLRDRIIGSIEAAGHEPCSYSGRGMWGEYCLGVDLPGPGHLVNLGGVPVPAIDQLGKGIIAYWPGIPPPENHKVEPECDECGCSIPQKLGGGLDCRHHSQSCSLWSNED